MSMAANPNMNFHHHHHHHHHHQNHHHGVFPPSFYSQHVVSFQPAGVGVGVGGEGGGGSMMLPPGGGGFPGNLLESVPGLKHDAGLAVDWSFNEQALLNDGLVKFSNEPGMMKYIKIAALLPEKTVRDVALRCRWMAKENVKRRKLEENYAGKKIKDRKERIESSAKASIHLVPPDNVAAYSFMMHHANHNNQLPFEVPAIDSATQHLLEENIKVLTQISENLSTCKLENNIDLLSHSRDNMTTILNRMSEMPGIMSQMPPLPVTINEDLMNSILPSTNQALMFGTSSGINLKQEPRC